MNFKEETKRIMSDNGLWNDNYIIEINRNMRGQSISFFVCDEENHMKYIVKFFDYFKGINIPNDVDAGNFQNVDEYIEHLAMSDGLLVDIEEMSEVVYYNRRSFNRYVQVCQQEEIGFPRVYAYEENLKIENRFGGVLVEEAIDGITLEEYIKQGKYEKIEFAIQFLWKFSLIIEKYVKYGIVHRDLSPDNIMVCGEEMVVIDPGVVKFVGRNTTEIGYAMGKRIYVSPEQFHGLAVNADFTSDLYSIALIVFEIICGINPLKMYIKRGVTNPHEEILNKFDRELEDIFFAEVDDVEKTRQLYMVLRKMLQVEKMNRFTDIESFQEMVDVLKEGR